MSKQCPRSQGLNLHILVVRSKVVSEWKCATAFLSRPPVALVTDSEAMVISYLKHEFAAKMSCYWSAPEHVLNGEGAGAPVELHNLVGVLAMALAEPEDRAQGRDCFHIVMGRGVQSIAQGIHQSIFTIRPLADISQFVL